jgi:methyl-accepting chemotaxis protein
MDNELTKALKKIIKDEIGNIVSDELKLRFEPLQRAIDTIQKSNDQISEQIREDRVKIDKIEVSQAKSEKQNSQIIDNQNNTEEQLVNAVKEEAQKIPKHTEKAVENMFDTKPLLKKIKEKFIGRK